MLRWPWRFYSTTRSRTSRAVNSLQRRPGGDLLPPPDETKAIRASRPQRNVALRMCDRLRAGSCKRATETTSDLRGPDPFSVAPDQISDGSCPRDGA